MKPIEFYATKTECTDEMGNSFSEDWVLIPNFSIVNNNNNYLFFNKIVSPNNFYHLYLAYDRTNKIAKLGQSNRPFKRASQHASNFVAYGGSSFENILLICSRYSFDSNTDMERKLLNEFRSSFPNAPQRALEFFSDCNESEVALFMKTFLSENKRYQYK